MNRFPRSGGKGLLRKVEENPEQVIEIGKLCMDAKGMHYYAKLRRN